MEQDAYTAGQQDFNLPHDVIQLPSGGIFYKSKKKTVKVGYLTAIDENIIAEADFKKRVVWIFVVEQLIALLEQIKGMLGCLCLLDTSVAIFSPGDMNYPAVSCKKPWRTV